MLDGPRLMQWKNDLTGRLPFLRLPFDFSSINHVNYVIANNFPAHGEHVLHRQIVAGQANSGTEPLNH